MTENSAESGASGGSRVEVRAVRPLRRDAERNRQRILKAASEVFNERGLDVSLDEIARHAGVGVGTVYRRFRTKEELIEALFMDRLDSVATIAGEAYESPDAWCGLVTFMERMAELMAGNLGLRQMLMFATYGRDLVAVARQRNEPFPSTRGTSTAKSRAPAASSSRSTRPGGQALAAPPGSSAPVPARASTRP